MKNTNYAKTRTVTRTNAHENTQVGLDDVTKTSITVMGAVSALIGIWAAASLIAAMVSVGGPLALVKGWVGAVSGLW